jgi:hypothetical protein
MRPDPSVSGIDHRGLYRLPWSLPDNAISWLEPTSACNMACDGCYRENVPGGHKSLEDVREEIRLFRRMRTRRISKWRSSCIRRSPRSSGRAESGMKLIINERRHAIWSASRS